MSSTSFKFWLKQLTRKNMTLALLMGFASGLPLFLSGKTLLLWMREDGINLQTIGLFSLVSLPYAFKFVWAPIMDLKVFSFLGRRRSWLLISQIGLILCLLGFGFVNPSDNTFTMALLALFLSFFSASQDIVIDAFRRESLTDHELGLGSSYYVYGYRVALLLAGGLVLIFADFVSWHVVYALMALSLLIVGVGSTLWADEPSQKISVPQNLKTSVVGPLKEFFNRRGWGIILAFILFYKLGDSMAGYLSGPFYLDMNFTKSQIGTIAKGWGFISSMGGLFVGGLFILKRGIYPALWFFGILQALSTLSYALLVYAPSHLGWLTFVVAFEDFSSGMGTAAFVAFMALQTNKRFTATQYALLTSLTAVPRTFFAAPTGFLVASYGWLNFFILCTLIAIPGLILIRFLSKTQKTSALES